MKTFFVADTHFGDDNIRRYENRPFETTEEMDTVLIENWNSAVTVNDEVYVLGDFGASGYEEVILSREVAMIRFSACENSDTTSQTEYIKEIIKGCHKQERIDADIIEKTVERITMTQDKMMIVRLINGKEISERMT